MSSMKLSGCLLAIAFATTSAVPAPPREPECVCDTTSILAPITVFSACLDMSTSEFGVEIWDGWCTETCLPMEPCSCLVYAVIDIKSSCNAACKGELRSPGRVNQWVDYPLNIPVDLDCGGSATVGIQSRCGASCTGSCADTNARLYGVVQLECSTCAPDPD